MPASSIAPTLPRTTASPSVGGVTRAMIFISVLLPEPLRPITPTTLPSASSVEGDVAQRPHRFAPGASPAGVCQAVVQRAAGRADLVALAQAADGDGRFGRGHTTSAKVGSRWRKTRKPPISSTKVIVKPTTQSVSPGAGVLATACRKVSIESANGLRK